MHVHAVLTLCEAQGVEPEVVDASSLEGAGGSWQPVSASGKTHGWVRRLARPDWHSDIRVDSHEAAVRSTWLAFLQGVLHDPSVEWITPIGSLVAAESKVHQLRTAHNLGIPIPRSIVSSDLQKVRSHLAGHPVVAKPLGPSVFMDGPEARFVPAQDLELNDVRPSELAAAPFVFQERLTAMAHWRVVTVRESVFAARLDASDLPLDWRTHDPAHDSFIPAPADGVVAARALALARHLGLGYSSQDWIETSVETYFIDLNPAGQWLFLPSVVAHAVTATIAKFVVNG